MGFFRNTLVSLLGGGALLLALLLPAAKPVSAGTGPLHLTPAEAIWLHAHPVVRTRISTSYPPFEFIHDGQYQGLAVDYLHLIGKRLGIRFEPTSPKLTWSDALDRLKKKNGVDLILLLTKTPERQKRILFTRDYLSFPLVVFDRKGGPFISGLHDLRGKSITVEKGFIVRNWLDRDLPESRIVDVDDSKEALQSVAIGTADAYVGNLAVGSYLISSLGLSDLMVAAPTPYGLDGMAMGVRNDWPQLAAIMDKALASISPEEAQQIHSRWLSVRYEYGLRFKDVLLWSSLVATVLLLFILQLRHLVKSRTVHLEREIAERKETERALEESRSRYQSLVDSLPIGVNMIDSDFRIVMCNAAIGEWLGKECWKFVGRSCFQEFEKREEICPDCPGEISMKTGEIAMAEREGVREDGSRFAVRVRTVPLGPLGKPSGFIEMVEDLTEIRKAQDEKTALENQLRQTQKMEAIGTLAGGIAHDFNNILTPIIGYTELAKEENRENPEVAESLNFIEEAAHRATDLVRQILTFSRKGEMQKQPLQISVIVKEALKLLRASIPTTIEIRQNIASQALVLADPIQIHQIVMNLCTNAYQAMEQEGGILAVSLHEQEITADSEPVGELPAGQYVVFSVGDTGCGMDDAILPKIYEPYFTTKEKGKGTGLGLAVVHGIVRDHQGWIAVDSEKGQGTTFRVFLPRCERPARVDEVTAPPPRLSDPQARILLAEDEERIAQMIQRYLTGHGYSVEWCGNGRDGLVVFEQDPKRFDLLITDMTMPGMNGKEFAQKVLALRPDLPVILCTGYSSLIDREEATRLGIKDYVEKPLNLQDLLNRIRTVL